MAYPTFESFKAIESTGTRDDTQWLSYWVVFAVYGMVEKFTWVVLRWIPLYSLMKLAFLAWLVVPQYRGASFVYSTYVRPLLLALADKAKDIPAMEPYVRDFSRSVQQAVKKAEVGVTQITEKVQEAAEDTYAPLKAHAQ